MDEEYKGLVEMTTPSSRSEGSGAKGDATFGGKTRKTARLLSLFVIQGLVIGLTLSYIGDFRSAKSLLSVSQDWNPELSTSDWNTPSSSLEKDDTNTKSLHLTKQFNFDATTKDITEAQVSQIQRPTIYYLQASEQDPAFFACHTPKTGCTGWKNFYLYLNHKKITYDGTKSSVMNVHNEHEILSEYQQSFNNNAEVYASLFNSKHRIVITRNPYIRFLSSYKDYLRSRAHKTEEELPFTKFIEIFEQDRHELQTGSEICGKGHQCPINHIESVSKYCSVDLVGGYTVLRVEQQYAWFDAHLDYFGLTSIMEEYTEKGGPKLFESGTEYVVTKDGILVNPEQNKIFEAPHNQNSGGQLMDYYTSKEIVDRVTKLFMDDFINFGYPLWDGRPETFREA